MTHPTLVRYRHPKVGGWYYGHLLERGPKWTTIETFGPLPHPDAFPVLHKIRVLNRYVFICAYPNRKIV